MNILKRSLKILSIIFLSFVALLVLISIYFAISVKPTVWLVRWAFNQSSYSPHEELSNYQNNVLKLTDLEYESNDKNNTYDIFIRHDLREVDNNKTIIWIHGGAFIAGDKKDVSDYMYVLANEGYAVVSMNYGIGYESKFPAPLLQINELYNHLQTKGTEYSYLDLNNLVIGGDSAGAFIAAQYALIISNPIYSEKLNIEGSISNNSVKGLLLFCGPYDFELLKNLMSNTHLTNNFLINKLVPTIVKKIGTAFLGDKKWDKSDKWDILSLTNYVTSDFPPSFITDGNTASFEEHGLELEEKLSAEKVVVTGVYYEAILMHEYQFNLSTINEDGRNYGLETLNKVFIFLEETIDY